MGSDTPELPADQRVEGLLGEPGCLGAETPVGGGAKRRPRTPKSPSERRAPKGPKSVAAPNPCLNAALVPTPTRTPHYEVVLPFTPSTKGLTAYANHFKHVKVMDRRATPPKVTFDDKALTSLSAKYPDAIYSHLSERREIEKCLGTYVNGIVPFIKPSGRLCGEMAPTTLTLRLAQKAPSLLNLPRVEGESLYNVVREMYVAAPGHVLCARDFSGIEDVYVAYLAKDPVKLRISKIDPHSYYVSHLLKRPPDLGWSDADIAGYLKEIKKGEPQKRQGAKKAGHAGNYGATAHKMWLEEPLLFPSKKDAQAQLDFYLKTLYPSVDRWHYAVCDEIEAYGFVTAPSGFRLHYTDVYDYTWDKEKGAWGKTFGASAKEAFAAVPQHLGAVALMTAATTMCREWPEFAGMLRLLIHDELLAEVPENEVDLWDARMKEVMERPLPCLPCPPEWGQGDFLSVRTEGKRGGMWGEMR